MPDESPKFRCDGCGRKHPWKKELSGKRGKCKCGEVMIVPPEPEAAVEDDLYALADEMETAGRKAASAAPPVVAPSNPPDAPQPVLAGAAASTAAKLSRAGVPLAYQRIPTSREIERNSSSTTLDKKRDIYVPFILIIVGAALYVGYYSIRYQLGGAGILAITLGLVVMAIVETALLMGFATTMAGPMGVSFGGIGTAFLKFGALSVFCDGAITCVDGFVGRFSGGFHGSVLGYGAIGLPVALPIYWFLLTYLFSMHPSDSWYVVAMLSVFYWIVRVVCVVLLLKAVFSLGGSAASSISLPGIGGGTPISSNPIDVEVADLQDRLLVREARQFAKDRGRTIEAQYINDWYTAGSPNVWFGVARTLEGKVQEVNMIIELPNDPQVRIKLFAIAKKYCSNFQTFYSVESENDPKSKYMIVHLP